MEVQGMRRVRVLKGQREYLIQREFVKYIKLKWRNSILYCASAGGLHTSYMQAAKMKAAGYVKGYPDMTILEPAGGYHGLFIEIKAEEGSPTKEQRAWAQKLNARGYKAVIAKGLEECIDELENYLRNGKEARKKEAHELQGNDTADCAEA
jgi:hypothetical protein